MNQTYVVDRCAACLSPESFYLYAEKHGMTPIQYAREFPCNNCDARKVTEK